MTKKRILYVSQEITPFLPETDLSLKCRTLPQGIAEKGKEIRVFMPRYGKINERRHQLHEVIRLSGMNMIINDSDHPLIIKVASIPTIRMQVYFIDNEEYFHRKAVLTREDGSMFEDNDERSIFFIRGVLETVKKLGWSPDIIHCQGWMSALLPLYLKTMYKDDPHFVNTKLVYSLFGNSFKGSLDKKLIDKVAFDGVDVSSLDILKDPTCNNLHKLAVQYSDGVIECTQNIDAEVSDFISKSPVKTIGFQDSNMIPNIDELYDSILESSDVLIEE